MKYVVASADEIPAGGRKIVTVAGRSIGIFNLDGDYFALRNRCPHQGGALCEGKLWGVLRADVPGVFEYEASREILTCPWHGWEFHVRTGQSWCDPRRLRVRRFDVTVEDGKTLTAENRSAGPLTAEPRTAETLTAETLTVDPRTAEPRTAEPRTAEPRTAEPRTAEPRTAEPRTAETLTAEPRTAETLTAEPEAPSTGLVRGPYLVETYPVSIEGTYLVVDLDTRHARRRA